MVEKSIWNCKLVFLAEFSSTVVGRQGVRQDFTNPKCYSVAERIKNKHKNVIPCNKYFCFPFPFFLRYHTKCSCRSSFVTEVDSKHLRYIVLLLRGILNEKVK